MSTIKATNFQHASAAAPAIVLAADGSATANVASINNGPLAGMRNAIINGNFDIWQRGTSFTGNEYGADRWIHGRVGTTHTATRQPFTLGQTDVPGEPTYYCSTVVSSGAGTGDYANLVQYIEGVRTFAGQQVTISFWAKADATKNIAVELAHVFGSGGSPSATVVGINVTKVSIGTSWQKIIITANVPSIGGKTLGTDNNHYVPINIFFDAGSDFNARTDTLGHQSGTFDIAQIQLEPGPVATPFERRPIGTELALCQRYYSRWLPGGSLNFSAYAASSVIGFPIAYPQEMRVVPTLAASLTGAAFDTCSFLNFASATKNGARFTLLSSAISNNANMSFGASDYLEASAEL